MKYSVAKLGPDDLAAFRELLLLFERVFHDRQTPEPRLPTDEYLRHLLNKSDLHVFAALDGARVAGGVTGYELELCTRDAKEIYVYDVAVDEGYRRQGVARSLVGAMRQFARDRSVSVLFVEAHAEDSGAVAFYQALGAEMEDVKHFNLDVLRD
ncbi:MAG: GNAT family N-acetyltransferase [Planctomycetota bacterium]|nr:MAG: GNAT family N-acetyltransferase [Planctomycetota bacterium]